jgi:hypothetical protein
MLSGPDLTYRTILLAIAAIWLPLITISVALSACRAAPLSRGPHLTHFDIGGLST